MDRRERMDSLLVSLRTMQQSSQSDMWTALPGAYQGPGVGKMTANVQPTLQVQVRTQAGVWENRTLPVLLDCPVLFPGGGGFLLTFPLVTGDEGLVVFSSRCIDAWWQQGGVQPQVELRMHDLSDGFFIPGLFSQPRAPAGAVSATSTQLRSADGTTFIEVAPGGVVNLHATNVVTTGNLLVGANLTVTNILKAEGPLELDGSFGSSTGIYAGDIRTAGEVEAKALGGSVTLSTHNHPYQESTGPTNPADTGPPTPGS